VAIAMGWGGNGEGPVFLGPNSLGVVSRPGSYDTFFIPKSKLDKRWDLPTRPAALISQSGAFIVSRLSNLETLDAAFAISIGNQIDLTVSDMTGAMVGRDDVHAIGVYVEGFRDQDGLELLRRISAATAAGKEVVLYKAGRTEPGRSAAAGHTASVAGDYDICQAAAGQAGALVADTFREFEQLMELATALHDKDVHGVRIGAVSNAGFETVGVADNIIGQRYRVEMARLSPVALERLRKALHHHRLDGLVEARNPLDLTPMAPDAAYEDTIRVMADAEEVDAILVGVVPLTAALKSLAGELDDPDSLAAILPRLFAEVRKPMLVVVDSGSPFEPLVRRLREAGLPVFRSADQAVRSLGRYLCHRVEWRRSAGRGAAPRRAYEDAARGSSPVTPQAN
jgi:acyl-CoA synthetase (NDP forming)